MANKKFKSNEAVAPIEKVAPVEKVTVKDAPAEKVVVIVEKAEVGQRMVCNIVDKEPDSQTKTIVAFRSVESGNNLKAPFEVRRLTLVVNGPTDFVVGGIYSLNISVEKID